MCKQYREQHDKFFIVREEEKITMEQFNGNKVNKIFLMIKEMVVCLSESIDRGIIADDYCSNTQIWCQSIQRSNEGRMKGTVQ